VVSVKVLDLCCCSGGASHGIHQAFPSAEITGIDINEQPDYEHQFIKADVTKLSLEFLKQFDFIWASFPCQSYTYASKKSRNLGKTYPDLIGEGRKMLLESGKPFVIENVTTAPIRKDLVLCGQMFGLRVIRHRAFEIQGFKVQQLQHLKHLGKVKSGYYVTVAGHGGDGKADLKSWQEAMGIFWTKNKKAIAEAVPPAYSRYIFSRFIEQLSEVKVADGTPTTNDGIPPNNKLSGILPTIL
jgi:DNA (cytosine-5)-methyltransferase 1